MSDAVVYERRGELALITLNRPDRRNAQDAEMTYALDACFYRFSRDDEAHVAVLRGAGPHFSAGHDVTDQPWDHEHDPVSLWGHPHGKPGAEWLMAYEQDAFVGMCRRWREVPKPVIAMVQGACIGGALALAWACDLIMASSDAFFADPVVRLGCPGIEFFCHPWALGSRFSREFLFLGERISAQRAYELGMVNRVFDRDALEAETLAIAARDRGDAGVRAHAHEDGRQPGRGRHGHEARHRRRVQPPPAGPRAQHQPHGRQPHARRPRRPSVGGA